MCWRWCVPVLLCASYNTVRCSTGQYNHTHTQADCSKALLPSQLCLVLVVVVIKLRRWSERKERERASRCNRDPPYSNCRPRISVWPARDNVITPLIGAGYWRKNPARASTLSVLCQLTNWANNLLWSSSSDFLTRSPFSVCVLMGRVTHTQLQTIEAKMVLVLVVIFPSQLEQLYLLRVNRICMPTRTMSISST